MKALLAQFRVECTLTLRNKESLLLTMGIPVGLLVFFSLVDVLPVDSALPAGGDPVDVLAPGILALAIMSMSMTGLAIATGFERSYGVLKRLGTTPLGRPRLLAAKIAGVVAIEVVQAAVLIPVGLALGWRPSLSVAPAGRRGRARDHGVRRPRAVDGRARSGPRSPSPSPTASTSCSCCSAGSSSRWPSSPARCAPPPASCPARPSPTWWPRPSRASAHRAGRGSCWPRGRVAMPLVAARTFRWAPAR